MKFFDYIRFALKNIWRQKLRTALTIFAIIIGATSVVAMLSLVFGAKNAILGQIEASGALTQVNVTSSTDTSNSDLFGGGGSGEHSGKQLDDAFAAQLGKMTHVTSVTPVLSVYVFNKIHLKDSTDGKDYNFNQVQSFTPSADTDKKLAAGRNLISTDKEGKIILGSKTIGKMGITDPKSIIGKTVVLTTQKGFSGEGATIPKPPDFSNGPQSQDDQQAFQKQQQDSVTTLEAEVIGVTEAGPSEDTAFINLAWGRGLLAFQMWGQDPAVMEAFQKQQQALQQQQQQNHQPNSPQPASQPPLTLIKTDQVDQNGYDTLQLKIDDAANVENVATDIRKLGVGAITAKDTIATILNSFKIISLVLGVIGAISLLVAAIGVVNTMVMATLERTREIGVMRACGATRAAVRRLFTFEAAMLGFWGGVLGVLAGFGLGKIANIFAASALSGLGSSANIIQVPPWLALTVIGATTVVGVLAGMYPAYRASKMNPVEALRYD